MHLGLVMALALGLGLDLVPVLKLDLALILVLVTVLVLDGLQVWVLLWLCFPDLALGLDRAQNLVWLLFLL